MEHVFVRNRSLLWTKNASFALKQLIHVFLVLKTLSVFSASKDYWWLQLDNAQTMSVLRRMRMNARYAIFETVDNFWLRKENVLRNVQVLTHRLTDSHVMWNANQTNIELVIFAINVQRTAPHVLKQDFVQRVIQECTAIFNALRLVSFMITLTWNASQNALQNHMLLTTHFMDKKFLTAFLALLLIVLNVLKKKNLRNA